MNGISIVRRLGLLLLLAGCSPGEQTRLQIDWSRQPLAAGASLVPCGPECSALHLEAPAQDAPVALLRIDSPPIDGRRWALRGRIRHERVAAPGYLELWNHFGDGSHFFSRTLAPSGPMAQLSGDSDWRELLLPFDASGATSPLVALELNAVLPGGGVVEIEPLRLVQY